MDLITAWNPDEEQWWICSFNPNVKYEDNRVENQIMIGSVQFPNGEMYEAFVGELDNDNKKYVICDEENKIVWICWYDGAIDMKKHKTRNVIAVVAGIVIICGIVFLPSFLINAYFPKNSYTTVSEFDENEITSIVKTYRLNENADFEIISLTENIGRYRTYYTLKIKTDYSMDIINKKTIEYSVLEDDGIRGLQTEEWWTPIIYYNNTEAYLVTCADIPESLSDELVTYCNNIEKLFEDITS